MKSEKKAKEQLISELAELRQQIVELEASEAQRKRAEEALRESEERLGAFMDSAPDAFALFDSELNVVEMNKAASEMLPAGIKREDMIGKNILEIAPGLQETGRYDRYVRVIETGEPFFIEDVVPVSEFVGDRHLSVKVFKVGDGLGMITTDITERKRAEELHRSVVELAPDSIMTVNLKGVITSCNTAATRILGYSKDELIGKHFSKIGALRARDIPKFLRLFKSALRGDLNKPLDLDFRRKDGTPILAEVRVGLLKEGGRTIGLQAVSRDITERRRAEEALKEYSERLEEMVEERTEELRQAQEELVRKEKLAVLGQLAGGVGHELRNPLGVISNAVYYLKTILPDANETTKEYLAIISSEVRNSEKIVSDLLDLSRTKPGEREEVAVSALVAQALNRQSPPEQVKVTTEIAPHLPPLFVDPRQISQVLVNLITNAYDTMSEGGRLTVKAEHEKDMVYLSISDTGCGIPEENMERLFEPLFTTKARGIGLGLAVSKNLAEANGGRVEAESEEGKGSTFTVILPTKEAQA